MPASIPVVPVINPSASYADPSLRGASYPLQILPPAVTQTSYFTHTYVKECLLDSGRYYIGHWTVVSDGSADIQQFPILDPKLDFTVPFGPHQAKPDAKLTLTDVWYSPVNMSCLLWWDDLPPRPFWALNIQTDTYTNLFPAGGIADRTDVVTDNRRVLLTTVGMFQMAGKAFASIILKFRKD